jgi:hypothetical protein
VALWYLCSYCWQLSIRSKSDICLPWHSAASADVQTHSSCNDMSPQRQLRGHLMRISFRENLQQHSTSTESFITLKHKKSLVFTPCVQRTLCGGCLLLHLELWFTCYVRMHAMSRIKGRSCNSVCPSVLSLKFLYVFHKFSIVSLRSILTYQFFWDVTLSHWGLVSDFSRQLSVSSSRTEMSA